MITTLAAIYENDIFKPVSSLPETLKEHERVKILIENVEENQRDDTRVSKEIFQELLAEGMISRIPKGITDEEDDFEPVEFEGEPFSEMIIRERGE